jgi:hypothetical protein
VLFGAISPERAKTAKPSPWRFTMYGSRVTT